ncbi:MAG: riboflavin synthase [Dehalococcoidia bacterium]
MFTGIVEEIGNVRSHPEGGLEIEAKIVLDGTRLGDSICINGTCLTVTQLGEDWFRVDTVPETLRRTNLGDLAAGDPVNLERALAAGARMGGHFVQGHIEATARVATVEQDREALLIRFQAEPDVMRYVVEKGFIAIDGISLTVVSREAESFVITLIPYTQQQTNLGSKRPGDRVNLETDILAKYVESLIQGIRTEGTSRRGLDIA